MLGRMAAPPIGLPPRDPAHESRVWTVGRIDAELAGLSLSLPHTRDDEWRQQLWDAIDALLDLRLQLRTR